MTVPKKPDAVLEKCEAAFKAFIERDTPGTRAALAEARTSFREAAEAEFGAIADQHPKNDGPPNVTPVGPIEINNSALNIGPFVRSDNIVVDSLVDGAIHRDGDHEASNH
jgi:hypothetical protein